MPKHSPEEGAGKVIEFKPKEHAPLSQEERGELSGIYHRLAELKEEAEYMDVALGFKTEALEEERDSLGMRVLKRLAGHSSVEKAKERRKEIKKAKASFKMEKKGVGEGYGLILKERRGLLKKRNELENRLPTEERVRLQELRQELKQDNEPNTGEYEFTVPDAINPYREALLESGIPNIAEHPLAQEKRDVNINLAETLKADQDSYRSAGLIAWADNLSTVDWSKFTPDKRKIIEQEIKDGAIPIFMPDRATQLATTVEDFTIRLKPLWISGGQPQQVTDAFWWNYFKDLIANKAAQLVEGVPDRPYLSLQKPTQKPEERTTNKTVAQQLQEFAKIQKERQDGNRAPVHLVNPAGYAAFQKRFTEQLQNKCATANFTPTTLKPIDYETWARFINLPLSSDGDVPLGGFYPGNRQLDWDGVSAAYPNSKSGFRFAVGVEF